MAQCQITKPLQKVGGGRLLWTNPNQMDWGNGQTINVPEIKKVDFSKDLVYFDCRLGSSRQDKQIVCFRKDKTCVVVSNLEVPGGSWHARNCSISGTKINISTYSNWGGARILNLYVIKNAIK